MNPLSALNALRISAISVIVIAWAVAVLMGVAASLSPRHSAGQAPADRSPAEECTAAECEAGEQTPGTPAAEGIGATFAPHAMTPAAARGRRECA